MKFWAVLGKRGCIEKNLPTAISVPLFGVVSSTFCGQKCFLEFYMKIFLCPHWKVGYMILSYETYEKVYKKAAITKK